MRTKFLIFIILLSFLSFYRICTIIYETNGNNSYETCEIEKNKHSFMCSYSKEYNVSLILIPKSGSSTGRHLMKHELSAKDIPCANVPKFTLMIAIIRDPFKRFLSSYDEMFVRRLGNPGLIPKEYRRFAYKFKGMAYNDYEKIFLSEKLDEAFRVFVDDYDNKNVFDVHLSNQYSIISKYDSVVFGDLNYIKDVILSPLVKHKKLEYIRGRAYPRRFNVDNIDQKTIQKICELTVNDYCCLNIKIPKKCNHFKCRY